MILVDAQRTEIPYIYMTRKLLQINIAIDSYNKLNSALKSIGYLTKGKL